mgnify:CR=1 FL=1
MPWRQVAARPQRNGPRSASTCSANIPTPTAASPRAPSRLPPGSWRTVRLTAARACWAPSGACCCGLRQRRQPADRRAAPRGSTSSPVRAALGGGRLRLTLQMLAESTLVSAVGGVLGVARRDRGSCDVLVRGRAGGHSRGSTKCESIRWPCLFALATRPASRGIVCRRAFHAFRRRAFWGQAALTRAARQAPRPGRTSPAPRTHGDRESALALVLLTGAGLMMRTLRRRSRAWTGRLPIRPPADACGFSLTRRTVDRGRGRLQFFTDYAHEASAALPGVHQRRAGLSALPIEADRTGTRSSSRARQADSPRPELPSAAFAPVSDGYFRNDGYVARRGTAVRRAGRRRSSPAVTVVNETLARSALRPVKARSASRSKQGWPEAPRHMAPGDRSASSRT